MLNVYFYKAGISPGIILRFFLHSFVISIKKVPDSSVNGIALRIHYVNQKSKENRDRNIIRKIVVIEFLSVTETNRVPIYLRARSIPSVLSANHLIPGSFAMQGRCTLVMIGTISA